MASKRNPEMNRASLQLADIIGVESVIASGRFCAPTKNLFIPYAAQGMYGGQTVSQAMSAASLYVQKHAKKAPSNMRISSVHGIFISGGLFKNGDVFYDVTPLKVGRQFIVVNVTATQFISAEPLIRSGSPGTPQPKVKPTNYFTLIFIDFWWILISSRSSEKWILVRNAAREVGQSCPLVLKLSGLVLHTS
mgnify:CR=1 FL=1